MDADRLRETADALLGYWNLSHGCRCKHCEAARYAAQVLRRLADEELAESYRTGYIPSIDIEAYRDELAKEEP